MKSDKKDLVNLRKQKNLDPMMKIKTHLLIRFWGRELMWAKDWNLARVMMQASKTTTLTVS